MMKSEIDGDGLNGEKLTDHALGLDVRTFGDLWHTFLLPKETNAIMDYKI